jgi:hypothetical protein
MAQINMQEAESITEKFYNALNERGQSFVDHFANMYWRSLERKNPNLRFGEQAARHFAIVTLMEYWTGEIPEGWKP